MAGRAHALAACALLAIGTAASTARAAEVPELRVRVNDHARILAPDRAAALEQRLAAYEQRTGQQFVLLTVPSLDGDPIEDFSIRVAERWKLGGKGKDDGLILVIAPNDRKMRIEVGYGLEGTIPDAIAARVVRERLAPAFRRGDYAGGIDDAFSELMRVASGEAEPSAAPVSAPRRGERRFLLGPLLLPLIVFMLLSLLGGRRGRRHRGFWIGPAWGGGFGGAGGGFGGGGGGGFGGGGGGGFRGGGGGFGGGGASGGW